MQQSDLKEKDPQALLKIRYLSLVRWDADSQAEAPIFLLGFTVFATAGPDFVPQQPPTTETDN